jgi:uncharacterized protein YgiM (DUF1202 family)
VIKTAKVRATAAAKATVVVTLQKGASLIVLEQQGNWTHVEVPAPDGAGKAQQGWVYSSYLETADAAAAKAAPVKLAPVKAAAVKPSVVKESAPAAAEPSAAAPVAAAPVAVAPVVAAPVVAAPAADSSAASEAK